MLSGTQKDLGAKKPHPSTPANRVTKRVGFGIQPPGLNPASHVLTASYLIFLCLYFLICKTGIMMIIAFRKKG